MYKRLLSIPRGSAAPEQQTTQQTKYIRNFRKVAKIETSLSEIQLRRRLGVYKQHG